MKVLITGGAGYLGSVLTRSLLANKERVVVYDNLLYGGDSLISFYSHPRFEFIFGDIRDKDLLKQSINDVDAVVHLAALVGDPVCSKYPEDAKSINITGTQNVFSVCDELKKQRLIFASTCSNYGKMKDNSTYLTELSPLAPVSSYAEHKVSAEIELLSGKYQNIRPTVLRFATLYGFSLRPRFDLTINQFVAEALIRGFIQVYGENFYRPYLHVFDAAQAILLSLRNVGSFNPTIKWWLWNVGVTVENYTKKNIINMMRTAGIEKFDVDYIEKEEDPRDYKVSFEKIHNDLGFRAAARVYNGIVEIKEIIESRLIDPFGDNRSNVL